MIRVIAEKDMVVLFYSEEEENKEKWELVELKKGERKNSGLSMVEIFDNEDEAIKYLEDYGFEGLIALEEEEEDEDEEEEVEEEEEEEIYYETGEVIDDDQG